MHKPRAGHFGSALPTRIELLEDFDDIDAAERECVRQIHHGHSFAAAIELKPSTHKIYTL